MHSAIKWAFRLLYSVITMASFVEKSTSKYFGVEACLFVLCRLAELKHQPNIYSC